MISPGDVNLFHFVETRRGGLGAARRANTASTCPQTQTGDLAVDI